MLRDILHSLLLKNEIRELFMLPRLSVSVTTIVIVLLLIFLLLAWRFWTFTVLPFIRPQEPRELPYWIPGLYLRVFHLLQLSNLLT